MDEELYTLSNTVHIFLHDPVFIQDINDDRPVFSSTGGAGVIAIKNLSYFSHMYKINDYRNNRLMLDWTTKCALILDQEVYAGFITEYHDLAGVLKTSLFNILDRLVYNWTANDTEASINEEFINNPDFNLYRPQTINVSPSFFTGNAYHNDIIDPITIPDWVQFEITIPSGESFKNIELKIWTNNGSFESGYPISKITQVVPPLDFNTLLTGSLIGGGSNQFNVVFNSATLSWDKLHGTLRLDDSTGLYRQLITFYDTDKNTRLVPFNILYKGAVPGILAIRRAIREIVLNSGVGTYDLWRRRAPELFVEDQFYLIPQWNILTERPDQIIYPNISPFPILVDNTRNILAQYSSDYIANNTEVISASYDTLTMTSVPNNINVSHSSVLALHPTYQNFAANEQGFNWMAPADKDFSLKLNIALSIAAGKAENPFYEPREENGMLWIPYVVNYVEFYVLTKESFLNTVGL